VSIGRYFRRRDWDEERAREIEAYVAEEIADNLARGMSVDEAEHAARRKLGNAALIREEIYWMNSITFLEILWQDLRYAFRVLRKSPGFTTVAVLSLALGIGANTAVFSVVHAVLLRALPYPSPEQLVSVVQPDGFGAVGIPQLEFWKANTQAFALAAGYRPSGNRFLGAGSTPVPLSSMVITSDFFRTLGVSMQMGREFNSPETRFRGPQAIILSDGLWQRAFASDHNVLGRAVTLDDTTYTVVGVLPRGFWFPQQADVFIPLQPGDTLGDKGANTQMVARLKEGVSLQRALSEMPAVTAGFRLAHPSEANSNYRGLTVISYQSFLVGDVRMNLLLLFGAVALLLLIACSNLASLLLARLASRRREIAVRLSLGSSRGRLLQQFLIENALLTLMSSAAGLLVAYWTLHGLVATIPFNLPASSPIRLDPPVLLFMFGVATAIDLVFALAPFFGTGRLDVNETLKAGSRSSGGERRASTRTVLVVGEVALSVSLLVAAGLMTQSLYRLHQEPLGFTPRGIIAFNTPISSKLQKNPDAWRRFQETVLERLARVPGVQRVAGVNTLPLTGPGNMPTERVGHPESNIGAMEIRLVTPAYFETMQIPIRRGRPFQATDTAEKPAVIMVNDAVVHAWWPNGDAMGDQVIIGRFRGREVFKDVLREVVGIVADTKSLYMAERPRPTVYVPVAQAWTPGNINWVVRATLFPGLGEDLRRAISELDPQQRVGRFRLMREIVESTTATSRFDAWLFGAFGGLALALTAIGVYGLLSYAVARRTNEIGIRMALGASRGNVLRMVLRQGLALVFIGLGIGLVGAFAMTRLLESLLFGIHGHDPLTFVVCAVLLTGVGVLASYLPARRATRVDPMVALRWE
jgi:putative ABC transport system permease protein